MARISNYFHLCPINDEEELFGLAPDHSKGTVINTLGKNIIIIVKLSNQKQVKSWTVLDKLSCKAVYDTVLKQYVGVFTKKWIRCWTVDCNDINSIKKIKLAKLVNCLIPVENGGTIVLYEDGSCESLEHAIEMRKTKQQPQPIIESTGHEISAATCFRFTNDNLLLTYFLKDGDRTYVVYGKLDKDTLCVDGDVHRLELVREEKAFTLCGSTVVNGNGIAHLITIWSDRRVFMMPLRLANPENAPGRFVSLLNQIDVKQQLSVLGVSRDCIAIYGANASPNEGGALILYNTQFKIIESKQMFKVYFKNSKLWVVDTFIFLAAGQKLAAASFRISKEQLSNMLGSQRATNLTAFVDTECINAEAELEETLEYDERETVASAESNDDPNDIRQVAPRRDRIDSDIRLLQQHDIAVEVSHDNELFAEMALLRPSANPKTDQIENPTLRSIVGELERIGESEMSISDHLVRMCIGSNQTDELIRCIQSNLNVSEETLAIALKHYLSRSKAFQTNDAAVKAKLDAILSCLFDSPIMIGQLRAHLNFDDISFLFEHIFDALQSNESHLEQRSHSDECDEDYLLINWLSTIIDSHYHHFVLSKKTDFVQKLSEWRQSLRNNIDEIKELKSVTAMLYDLSEGKSVVKEHVASKWYSVEEITLY